MALQNQTFMSTAPSTTFPSALSPSSAAASINIVSPKGTADNTNIYAYRYVGDIGDAPANLSYTVQEAVNFGGYRQEEYGTYNVALQLAYAGCPQRDSTGKSMFNCSMSCIVPQLIFNDTATM